ncbi:MAG: transketolase [Christensenellaceae bacterium]|nr:transketolase [Christensenellaceae bacterium]
MKQNEQAFINAIRSLSADAIEKAKSGHPGTPLGAAPLAYVLYGRAMRHNPFDANWPNRDRFVLSAGHASMLLYSLNHLLGYGLSMDDIKAFRQWGSLTPGHPEYGHTPFVEITTGPLGQGIANAAGMAMAEKLLAKKFNREGFAIVDHYSFVLMGDGCIMEGISGEASSLAATLGLSKLIAIYDQNAVSIEGGIDIAMAESVAKRYEAYGWQVQELPDGNDVDTLAAALESAKADPRPSLIIAHTKIGAFSPKEGSESSHGAPLGEENVRKMKEALGLNPDEHFSVPEEAYALGREIAQKGAAAQKEWETLLGAYAKQYPELYAEYQAWMKGFSPDLLHDETFFDFDKPDSTRSASNKLLGRLAERVPNLIGGSADLAPSNMSYLEGRGDFSAQNPLGMNLHFGVREQAMAAIVNGMQAHGGLQTYCATFLVFSDYLKAGIRLSALMKLPVLYVLTHDSIGVGEDGPTHQPIEHLAALRSMPGVTLFRPADCRETAAAYALSLTRKGPTCLALSRQTLPLYEGSGKGALKGGYVLIESGKQVPDLILLASGSEVELIVKARELLLKEGIDARVVSMPSFELFEEQSESYKESVLPKGLRARVAVEAATGFGWHKYAGLDGALVTIDHFGASAPAGRLFEEFGMTADAVVKAAKGVLKG